MKNDEGLFFIVFFCYFCAYQCFFNIMARKFLLAFILLISCFNVAHAQFEEGKWYLNTSLTGLDLSHSKYEGTNFGFQVATGTFVLDNLSILVNFKGEYVENGMDETSVGAGARYYLSSCGLYGGLGLAYKHLSNSVNRKDLVCLTPELGYVFFLNGTITVEPAVYYDLSFSNCSEYSKLGFKIGFGFYF